MKNYNSFGISEFKQKEKKIFWVHDNIKVTVHLFRKIMYFIFYKMSMRYNEMDENNMPAMCNVLLGVL